MYKEQCKKKTLEFIPFTTRLRGHVQLDLDGAAPAVVDGDATTPWLIRAAALAVPACTRSRAVCQPWPLPAVTFPGRALPRPEQPPAPRLVRHCAR
jgi:hypothetical protein